MAVNVDTVYQRALALANKEQRGYITPQEYNLLANTAQMEIFEEYFYDYDKASKMPGTWNNLSDKLEIIEGKLHPFKKWRHGLAGDQLPSNLYRLEALYIKSGGIYTEVQRVDNRETQRMLKGVATGTPGLYLPTAKRPIFNYWHGNTVKVYRPALVANNLFIDYIKKPNKVEWGYVVTNEKALYQPANSADFQLHKSERVPLVYKILELAGITIAKPGLSQLGDKMEKDIVTTEK